MTHVPGASGDARSDYGPSTSHMHPNARQQHATVGQFTGFGFSPFAPLEWDSDYSDFANQYEPQGELLQEQHVGTCATNDFSIASPVTTINSSHQHVQSAGRTPATQAQMPSFSPSPPQPAQKQPVAQAGMKRKLGSDPSPVVSQSASNAGEKPSKRQNISRESPDASNTSPAVAAAADVPPPPTTRAAAPSAPDETASQSAVLENTHIDRRKGQSEGNGPQERVANAAKSRRVQESPGGLAVLPAGKVFPIQIGSELFRLSGASISSDAPSYFSHFFAQQLHANNGRADDVRTLYIDRDPDTFRDIALHLQGYHVTPRNGQHFVKLYADAQFYSLPRLNKQLFKTDIFVEIGGIPFQIPRDLFSAPGDSPNYFSLGFAQFFSTPADLFPGLDHNALLRPPSISPPSVPNRSGETFGELMRLLQGYDLEIRNDEHRSQLLRDAQYFHLKGLEQKLIPCQRSYNLRQQQSEILVRLEDIRQSGISVISSITTSDLEATHVSSTPTNSAAPRGGYVSYARPYTDDHENKNVLILEISSTESTTLHLPQLASTTSFGEVYLRTTFHHATLSRMASLISVLASKTGVPATQLTELTNLPPGSGFAVRVHLDVDSALEIDGLPAELRNDDTTDRIGLCQTNCPPGQEEWLWGGGLTDDDLEWTIKRAHWELRVHPVKSSDGEQKLQLVLYGVKLEIATSQRTRNIQRGFLGSG